MKPICLLSESKGWPNPLTGVDGGETVLVILCTISYLLRNIIYIL